MKIVFILLFGILVNCANIEYSKIDEKAKWINENIEYKARPKSSNWQTPEETLNLKSGKCTDMSILLMYMIKNEYNIDSRMDIILITVDGDKYEHSIVYVNGITYDPTAYGIEYQYEYLYSISYDISLLIANLQQSNELNKN